MAEYIYIERQQQLDLALTQIAQAESVAIDTESCGYHTYYNELSLIQISAGNFHCIIDAMSGLKLDSLARIFADRNQRKIFHAAESDLLELRRVHNFKFENIIDTMLMCRMLGHESCSLAALVERYLSVRLEKKEQKSNWKRRPLSRSQLDYAHSDTLYLESLAALLLEQIECCGFQPELSEEFLRLERLSDEEPHEREEEQVGYLRQGVIYDMTPEERGRLRTLFELRDRRARRINLAPFRVASNAQLIELAQSDPQSLPGARPFLALALQWRAKEGERIVAALHDSKPIFDNELPQRKMPDPAIEEQFRRLRRWRHRVAESRGIDPVMVLNNRALQKIQQAAPKSLSELESLDLLTPFKLKAYGEVLLELVANGKTSHDLAPGLPTLPESMRELKAKREMKSDR